MLGQPFLLVKNGWSIGLILNVMPCVLPVIALKILGFVRQGSDNPGRVRFLGIIYSLGVMVSFLALAGLVIGVKAAGHRAGWGMQFSSPQFLVILTILAVLTLAGADAAVTTTDMNIRFLAPCLSDATAEARVIKFGRTLCPVEVMIRDTAGKDVALAQVTYMRLEKMPSR